MSLSLWLLPLDFSVQDKQRFLWKQKAIILSHVLTVVEGSDMKSLAPNCQWLKPFKSYTSLACLSQARTGDHFMILFICCHSNIFRKGNKRGKKKNLLKDFMDIFPVYIITRLSSFWWLTLFLFFFLRFIWSSK